MWVYVHNYNLCNIHTCFPIFPFYKVPLQTIPRLSEEQNTMEPIDFQRTPSASKCICKLFAVKGHSILERWLERCTSYSASWIRGRHKGHLNFYLVIIFSQVPCQPSLQETQFLSLIST